ncbi:hypothetical protein GO002_15605 [Streptomyces eurocidicus]|uniref:Ferric oxidoreductase domain-containing protein n=1 Tax=Streptomyces eurocidicus TaxID=66423 RepID=A0A7W8F172_STREU|nr:hypothetical protein [Streptomyces eurocidicus]MBB5117455.1 hypothetical protein [Streptomyces eurocidicus]MBF6053298.1 hypothetical protein [Streptomyces eurocidicus]
MNRFLDHTGGVLTLVSLTATVVWGLIAADRLLLTPRARLLAQAVHRATAAGALGFLLAHIGVKVAESHASPGALLPFSGGLRGQAGLIGLGALAACLTVLAGATGALRRVFAGKSRTAHLWRALHACAYPAWCAALLHGLKAGRSPSPWVTACYALCLTAVACALVLRLRRAHRARPDGAGPAGPSGTAGAARTAAPSPAAAHCARTARHGLPRARSAPPRPAAHGATGRAR